MAMMIIENNETDPYFNIALDAYLVRHAPPDMHYVMLWRNVPAVIVGRYQNSYEEVHTRYCEEKGIAVVRRMSGGGAVYQDLGNLNFSLFVATEGRPFNDFKSFTLPVIETLRQMGIAAELTGRNDITVDGQKISGNAQYRTTRRLLHHGTILYDVALDEVARALNVRQDKIESKGIKSVRSRVTNIRPFLPGEVTFEDFRATLARTITEHNGGYAGTYTLTNDDVAAVNDLVATQFGTRQWNYGNSPPFNLKASGRFAGGGLEIRLFVRSDVIEECTIYGDFLGQRDIHELEQGLQGLPYDTKPVQAALEREPLQEYFGAISSHDVLQLMFDMTPVGG